MYGLDDQWILGPLDVLGDQLVVQSFATAVLQAVPGGVAEHMYGDSPLTTDSGDPAHLRVTAGSVWSSPA